MGHRVVWVTGGEGLLEELVDGEVDCVSRPGSETHRADAPIEPGRAFELQDGGEGLADSGLGPARPG